MAWQATVSVRSGVRLRESVRRTGRTLPATAPGVCPGTGVRDHEPGGHTISRYPRSGRRASRGRRRRRHARFHRGGLGLLPGGGEDRSRRVAGRGAGAQGGPPGLGGAQGRAARARFRPGQLPGPAAVRRTRRTYRRAEDHGRDGRRPRGQGGVARAVRRPSWWRRRRPDCCEGAGATASPSWSPARTGRPTRTWRAPSTSPAGPRARGRTPRSSSAALPGREPPPN